MVDRLGLLVAPTDGELYNADGAYYPAIEPTKATMFQPQILPMEVREDVITDRLNSLTPVQTVTPVQTALPIPTPIQQPTAPPAEENKSSWLWIVAVGAGVYYLSRKKRKVQGVKNNEALLLAGGLAALLLLKKKDDQLTIAVMPQTEATDIKPISYNTFLR